MEINGILCIITHHTVVLIQKNLVNSQWLSKFFDLTRWEQSFYGYCFSQLLSVQGAVLKQTTISSSLLIEKDQGLGGAPL